MLNAPILANSINEWATPIVQGAITRMANQNMITSLLSQLITPDRLMSSFKDYLSVPVIEQYIKKIPDHLIPNFSLDVIDGMIATRVEKGKLEVPMLGVILSTNNFKALKTICENNFREYGEPQIEDAPEVNSEVEA